MAFLKNILKGKTTAEDVLDSLSNFSNDTQTLSDFQSKALEYFGSNWKFNVELYISSLPEGSKENYLILLRNLFEYEKAINIWTTAQQIVQGSIAVTAQTVKDFPEYESYLEKFGAEGIALIRKLENILAITHHISYAKNIEAPTASDNSIQENETVNSASVNNQASFQENVKEDKTQVQDKAEEDFLKQEVVQPQTVIENVKEAEPQAPAEEMVVESSADTQVSAQEVVPSQVQEVIQPQAPAENLLPEEELVQPQTVIKTASTETPTPLSVFEKIKASISQDANKNELASTPAQEYVSETSDNKFASEISEIKTEPTETIAPIKAKEPVSNIPDNNVSSDTSWNLASFLKIHNFLSQSREVLSAISLYKNAPSIEEYPNYGFIIDTIDYMINKGNLILQSASQEDISKYFKGGKSELQNIITQYKSQREVEIEILPDETDVKPN